MALETHTATCTRCGDEWASMVRLLVCPGCGCALTVGRP